MQGRKHQTYILCLMTTWGLVLLLMSMFSIPHSSRLQRQSHSDSTPIRNYTSLPEFVSVCENVEKASLQTNLTRLLDILRDPNDRQTCAWIRMRVNRMWPKWLKAIYSLAKKHYLLHRHRRQVLLYLGFLSKKADWGFAESQFKGGFLGELVTWSDLIAGLYLLGHNVTVTTEFEEFLQHKHFLTNNRTTGNVNITSSGCKLPDNIIYTDIVGLRHITGFTSIPYHVYKCRVRVLDCYGTEAAFNHKIFSVKSHHVSDWGGWNLHLQQFYNMFPHTPDDTFLGFVVETNTTDGEKLQKENIAVVYGKNIEHWKGKETYLKQFHDAGYSVQATVHLKGHLYQLPEFVTNHDVLNNGGFQMLLRRAKIFVGLGDPLEGPAGLEAIAHGAVFINPKTIPPLNLMKKGKPTERTVTSQNPYIEQFIGEPYAYTINTGRREDVENIIRKINLTNKFVPFLPYEYTEEGYLQRLNAYVEHQDFCQYKHQNWPPDDAVKLILGKDGISCKDACWENNLICEPSHFNRFNSQEKLKINNIACDKARIQEDIYFPAITMDTNACILQADVLLFSCAGGKAGLRRLCPCRSYIQYQSGLCKGCDS